MPPRFVTTTEHYDRLADEMADPASPAGDPFDDPPPARRWMELADGPEFYAALGDVAGLVVLELGVGTGRVARMLLDRGCARLVGLDLSARTLARARRNLAGDARVALVCGDAATFVCPGAFNVVCCVWAFFHFPEPERVLANAVTSLKPGGRLVLSLERVDECLAYDDRRLRQYPIDVAGCVARLRDLGCRVDEPVAVADSVSRRPAPGPVTWILRAARP